VRAKHSWSVEKKVGAVVEIAVQALESPEEVKEFSTAIFNTAVGVANAILVVDLRAPIVFAEPIASAVLDLMLRQNNVRKKTAILLSSERAIFGLQLRRLTKQARDARRQTFTDPNTLLVWVEEDATDAEMARIRTFLHVPG
jgi:hypothetical protein